MPRLKGDLGPLERVVMEYMWGHGSEVTVRDVLKVPAARGLAYTTVMTVMERLWRKGYLSRRRMGRAYVYRARRTQEEHLTTLVGEVFARAKDRRSVLLGFVRSVDSDDLDELRRVIREVERERRDKPE